MADEYGRQAAERPSDINERELWACPAGRQFQGIVTVCNQSTIDQTYRVARCAAGHGDNPANNEDWRAYDVIVEPGLPAHEISVNMAAAETVRIKANTANSISFAIEGVLI